MAELFTNMQSISQLVDFKPNHTLKRDQWTFMAQSHKEEVSCIVDEYVAQKSQQKQDPVMDFMFTYYKYSPTKLKQWSPGVGVRMEQAAHEKQFTNKFFHKQGDNLVLRAADFPEQKIRGTTWIHALLKATDSRNPSLNCCGIHEWAMVYEADDIRHQQFPLRLSPARIKELVDSSPVVCSHFDAFRFFTPTAQPLNQNPLSRTNMIDYEQPGCLHTNMDLYKWCYKLSPWVPGHITLAAFKMACRARILDMKAGPYDLSSIGYKPILIETEEGRKLYKVKQAEIWKEAAPVRQALMHCLEYILDHHQKYELEHN